VLARRPAPAASASADIVDVLAGIGADLETGAVLSRIFDAVHTLFGATSGFCALFDGASPRIAQYRGLDHQGLVAAAKRPELKELLRSTELRVDTAANPAVAVLARMGEVAVAVPMHADGRHIGQLVLLMPDAPDAPRRALLSSFAHHAASVLRAAGMLQQLGDHEEQLASMVHSMANPVVVVDEEARVVEVNGAASEVFRLASTFETGHPVAGRLGNAQLEELLSAGGDGSVEVVLGAEEPRVYRATVRRVRSSAGRMMGRILVLDDLTSERQLEAVKADFVAVMGHELRTPLTVMKGYLHTLVRRWDSLADDRRVQALDALQSNMHRLERLIEDLLFISSIEQRRCQVDLSLVDVSALVEERAAERVTVRRPRRPIEMEIDRPKVEQVLQHLLDNAIKYSEGPVVLELADKGDMIEISVTDSGPGIYSGDIPFLFERFRQLDGSSTRAHGGVGIGLYICKRIVDAVGGRIWCDSRLGVGSRFVFTLPKDAPTAVSAADRSAVLA
jgi:signal transduction histidine kinase